jgi:LmbE family N-acetylglucosaminyl deacetylase
MKILHVHAHFDDFEFAAAGTFELWRRQAGRDFRARVIVCGDGKAGHQFRTREETGALRLREQEASARLGGYEFELLRLPDGRVPREGVLQTTVELLAALWKAIRDFEPDYLFCPPLAADPLAGVHNDHLTVAEAVRRVAYMINVPHAFTPEYPADETRSRLCKVPVILNVYDSYMSGENAWDLAVDVEAAFDRMVEMSYCHQSQLTEWLPWVGRHGLAPPRSLQEWTEMHRQRLRRRNRELGIDSAHAMEVFTVTAWGELPILEQLQADFPNIQPAHSHLEALQRRLRRWRGEPDTPS